MRIIAALAALMLLSACASKNDPNTYANSESRRAVNTYSGVIQSSRPVAIKDNDNVAGTVGGGALGGVAGAQLGKGQGSTAGAIGGVLAGAVLGNLAEQHLMAEDGFEYVIKLDADNNCDEGTVTVTKGSKKSTEVKRSGSCQGRLLTVAQAGQQIAKGTKVYVMDDGVKARIVPQ
ncbi:MAG: glycine zipper 2TM domain-containing protein [Proteobacteria bacterium]|nr:glycine zipper 2TM domain-containing protein [Pseudomonadota bacterium]